MNHFCGQWQRRQITGLCQDIKRKIWDTTHFGVNTTKRYNNTVRVLYPYLFCTCRMHQEMQVIHIACKSCIQVPVLFKLKATGSAETLLFRVSDFAGFCSEFYSFNPLHCALNRFPFPFNGYVYTQCTHIHMQKLKSWTFSYFNNHRN